MAHDDASKALLDDAEFRVCLDPESTQAEDMAIAFLERRCLTGAAERIGSVHLQADQTWLAAMLSGRDEFIVVAKVANRLDAIVALWQHRREAFLGHCAL